MSASRIIAALPLLGLCAALAPVAVAAEDQRIIRSARSGPWSAPDTWQGGKVPDAGSRVQVRGGHVVLYDAASDQVIRSIHVAGTLEFARDRDTRLNVGLVKIQAGDDASEDGFQCDAHPAEDPAGASRHEGRPALMVGTADQPIPAHHSALIRLVAIEGMDRDTCPAIVCCGGRMDLHGAELKRTWVKLGSSASVGDLHVRLAEPVSGWRAGDRVIVTTTRSRDRLNQRFSLRPAGEGAGAKSGQRGYTEERTIAAIDGDGVSLTLDRPLEFPHEGSGDYRGEVANLSRNVIVESAEPDGIRGHTMYHRGSAGSVSYAEFRHLGKEGILGKYSLHFHLVGDTMRGSSVIGASIWDSHNRWITLHGTNYLVVRDCVGYQSVGHGFYLEDGTEAYNVLDRNLAVQAFTGRPLPQQNLPFDPNDGAGFWWANSRNTFTRNVAAECDRYGFRFEATAGEGLDLRLPVLRPDGSRAAVDIRTLPFVRFEANEAHDQILGVNLGGLGGDFFRAGLGGVMPDAGHPFQIRDLKIWNTHWAFAPHTRYAVDGLDIADSTYGLFLPDQDLVTAPALPKSFPENRPADSWGRVSFVRCNVPVRLPDAVSDARYFAAPFDLMEFAGDCLPPTTVITHVSRPAGAPGMLHLRGIASDEGAVARVMVNGRAATPVSPGFAEWQMTLDGLPDGDVRLSAAAVDAAGNAEPRPHAMMVRMPAGQVLDQTLREAPGGDAGSPASPPRREPNPASATPTSPSLVGVWSVVSQQRAGQPVERPARMRLLITGNEIWLLVGKAGEAYHSGNVPTLKREGARLSLPRGALMMSYRLDSASTPGRIDLEGLRKASHLGIYRLDGNELTLCLGTSAPMTSYGSMKEKGLPGGDRPNRFDSESGTVIFLRRLDD